MDPRQYIPRLDLNKLVLYKNVKSESYGRIRDDHDNPEKMDFNRPFKVFLTDGANLYEIYSSKKDKANENKLYVVDQAEEAIKRRRLQVVSDSQLNQQVPKHTKSKQNNEIVEFPLTGPVGDVIAVSVGFFRVIIHQEDDTDDNPEEFDYSHLLRAYACGEIVSQSDVIFTAHPDEKLYHVKEGLFTCNIFLSVGMLTLSCVFFNVSRLVTVRSVKWLHGDDATTTTDLIITGGLFLSSFKDHKSVLFETPRGKAIKVKHGQLIPLLRSAFAVIDGSSFTFGATVSSARCGSLSVTNTMTFESDDFFEENNFTKSGVIDCGICGKMQVVVTMKPNVLDYNRKHKKAFREVCANSDISWPLT